MVSDVGMDLGPKQTHNDDDDGGETRECEGRRSKGLTGLFCISAGAGRATQKGNELRSLQLQWERRKRKRGWTPCHPEVHRKPVQSRAGPWHSTKSSTTHTLVCRKEVWVAWGHPYQKTGQFWTECAFGFSAQSGNVFIDLWNYPLRRGAIMNAGLGRKVRIRVRDTPSMSLKCRRK